MSLKYIDSNGASHVVSGMTPGGNLETGAVATREGTATNPTVISKNGGESIAVVTFADAMPDADYDVSCTSWEGSSAVVIHVDTTTVSVNGFSLKFRNTSVSGDLPANAVTIHWKAFKLYEVADAEQLYSTVQDIEAMIPSSASSTNKFATASDLRTESRALDRRLDDVEDCIPSSADISNQLVTQSDLNNVSIDELGDIQDVDVSGVTDGQTIIWDDANQKWVNGQGGKVYSAGDGISISNTDEISAKVDDTSITTDSNDALKVADTYKTTFVGTKAEWDALTTEQKKAYKIANITDDVIGGEVADEVTDGLMSPVTSNAVAGELKISSYPLSAVTLTNIDESRMSDDYIHMEQTGNMFKITFDGIIFTDATAGATIISNLPHPSSVIVHGRYGFLMDNFGTAFALLQILSNGTLKVFGQKITNRQTYWGDITYFID